MVDISCLCVKSKLDVLELDETKLRWKRDMNFTEVRGLKLGKGGGEEREKGCLCHLMIGLWKCVKKVW